MHNHDHCCEHKNLGYCKLCQVVYCKDCEREWKDNPYTYTYPNYPTYPQWTRIGDTITVSSGSISTLNTADHCHA
jgi:hypothetical protein